MMNEIEVEALKAMIFAHGLADVLTQISRIVADSAAAHRKNSGKWWLATSAAKVVQNAATAVR
jgi:hypothetical protein